MGIDHARGGSREDARDRIFQSALEAQQHLDRIRAEFPALSTGSVRPFTDGRQTVLGFAVALDLNEEGWEQGWKELYYTERQLDALVASLRARSARSKSNDGLCR